MLSFYDRLMKNALTNHEIALWHALLHQSEMLGGTDEFNVSMSQLTILTGDSNASVKRARISLAEKGYIKWWPRGGRQSAIYRMMPLASEISLEESKKIIPAEKPPSTSTVVNADLAKAVQCYESNVCSINRATADILLDAIDEFGVELVCRVITEAATSSTHPNAKYIQRIFERCRKQGIKSVEAFDTEKAHAAEKRSNPQSARPSRANPFLEDDI